ncbi:MAG TPA: ABC transporter ATP-binding protein [Methanobacteriaceae archaeon]|nr:ABC transporter ATP-binding protein [Methanobacteriaceae archaeon]
MSSRDVMIEIKGLSKWFGKIQALDNLNLDIKKGELLGIIGPNGAGKTTAIRITCCILKPDHGDIIVDGYSIHQDPLKIKSIIGYLPEEPNLYERFKARDLLRYFAELYGVPKADINPRIDELLELVGMTHRAEDRINTFSKGLRQRIGIARALVHDPNVIIFDEPTMGLDPATSQNIRNFIRQLKGDKTMILCTHYMDEADQLCDRVALLDQGRIRDMGTPDYLKSKIHGDIILQIRVQDPRQSDQEAINALSSVESLEVVGGKYQISLKSRDEISYVIDILGSRVISVNTKEPTLDDVFIRTVEE